MLAGQAMAPVILSLFLFFSFFLLCSFLPVNFGGGSHGGGRDLVLSSHGCGSHVQG